MSSKNHTISIRAHPDRTVCLIALFVLGAACTPQPTVPPGTTTPANTPPALTRLVVNGTPLSPTGTTFAFPTPVEPEDVLHVSVEVQADSAGELQILAVSQHYTPGADNAASISLDIPIPPDLASTNLPVTLTAPDGQRAEYTLVIVPGGRFPPVISVAATGAATGHVSLDVTVLDLNGPETIASLDVRQVLNPQATGNKQITEYISNVPLDPITVEQGQPGSFKVSFEAEWPGRYPLALTATDTSGNATTLQIPLEVHWAEQPFDIRGVGTGPFAPGDPDYYSEYLDRLSTSNANLLQVMVLGHTASTNSSEVVDCPYEWDPNIPCNTSSPSTLQNLIQEARNHNLQVMLAPQVVVGNWEGQWLMSPNWDEWFSFDEEAPSYSNWLLTWARFAQENHIEYFEVGTEAIRSHSQPQHWEDLIAKVRTVYSGDIGYGDNYLVFFTDGGLPFPACQSLDFYGIQFYFHATGGRSGGQVSNDPSLSEMRTNLTRQTEEALERLQGFCKDIPIIISETGVDAQDGASSSPEAYSYEHPTIDFQEQVDYFTIVWGLAAQYKFKGVVTTCLQPRRSAWSYDPAIPGDLRDVPTLDALRIFYTP